jgi:hypothetical protein
VPSVRVWRAFALQPHRVETCKLSKDPLFIDKVQDIVGLYPNPPDRALVLCADDKSQIQALDQRRLVRARVVQDQHPAASPVHLHFTPTSASWLDLVERWFAKLTEKQLRRSTYASTRALVTAIEQYLDLTNHAPKPFVWTKTADEILASVARFGQRISNSGH